MTTQPNEHEDPVFTIGDRLRKAREHAGMDQSQLAEATGISRASVVNYEKGHTRPRAVVLKQWALATGVREDWLRGLEPGSTGRYRGDPVSITQRADAGRFRLLHGGGRDLGPEPNRVLRLVRSA